MKRSSRCSVVSMLASVLAWAQATAQLNGRVTDESGARAAGRHGHGDADRHRLHAYRRHRRHGRRTSCRTCRSARTGSRSRCRGSAPTCRPASCCRSAPARRSMPCSRVGNLEETVSVEAAAPIVDVRSAGISDVVEQERILELPLQGRQVTDLILLAGAAVQTGAAEQPQLPGRREHLGRRGPGFGVAYLLDGAMHNDPVDHAGLPLPFPDALQEFRVATSGLSAQNGIHSGASVNAVTKSGTNNFHGNAVRVPARQAIQRDQPVCRRSARTASGRTTACIGISSAERSAGRSSGTSSFSSAAISVRSVRQAAERQRHRIVPTAAMLAGDFTAFASPPATAGGRSRCGRRSSTTASIRRSSVRRR